MYNYVWHVCLMTSDPKIYRKYASETRFLRILGIEHMHTRLFLSPPPIESLHGYKASVVFHYTPIIPAASIHADIGLMAD